MLESEALEYVRVMGLIAQKCRSNVMESHGWGYVPDRSEDEVRRFEDTVEGRVSETLFPWLFGDKCILRAVEIVQGKGTIEPSEFYNLCWVAHRPEMWAMLSIGYTLHKMPDMPEPDASLILHGWGD